jgi:hypothetical protein
MKRVEEDENEAGSKRIFQQDYFHCDGPRG